MKTKLLTPTSLALMCGAMMSAQAMATTAVDGAYVNDGALTDGILFQSPVSDHSSATNSGTIDATSGIHAIKVTGSHANLDFITNSGALKGQWNGVSIENSASVDTITNSGTISANKQYGIFVSSASNVGQLINTVDGTITGVKGVNITGDGFVNAIDNAGTISGSNTGLAVTKSNVGTIKTDGAIQGGHLGLDIDASNVMSIEVGQSGSITSTGKAWGSYGDFGVRVIGSNVVNFNNQGTIHGASGLVLQNGRITTLTNSGTISGNVYGIYLSPWYNSSNVGTLVNTGTIQGNGGAGIMLEPGGSFTTITNSGKIIGSTAGISNVPQGSTNNPSYIGTLTVTSGGLIQGNSSNGIEFRNQGSGDKLTGIGTLVVDQGGLIQGKQNGLYFQKGTGAGQITVNGQISGGTFAINNEGTIGTGSGYAIIVGTDGVLTGTGSRQGGIRNSATGQIVGGISVAGTISGGATSIINAGVVAASANTNAINIQGNVPTIVNQGTLDATGSGAVHGLKVWGANAKVDSITNQAKGQIQANWNAISIEGNATVGSLVNDGTLTAGQKAIYVNTSTVDSIVNNGTLSGNTAVLVDNQGHVGQFDVGNVNAKATGVLIQGGASVDALTVASGKSIIAGPYSGPNNQFGWANAGIRVTGRASVGTLTNDGHIQGGVGVVIQNADVDTINNTGTISTDSTSGLTGSLYFIRWYGNNTVGTINNSGTIESATGYGVLYESGLTVDNFVTSGTIKGKQAGIAAVWGQANTPGYINQLTIADGGEVIGNMGIKLENQSKTAGFGVGTLHVAEGGKLTGTSSTALTIASLNGVKQIVVDGQVSGATNAIVNNGTIGETPYEGNAITVSEQGSIKAAGSYGVLNNGTINGNVVLLGDVSGQSEGFYNNGKIYGNILLKGDLKLNNEKGYIDGVVKLMGPANLYIENWNVTDARNTVAIDADSVNQVKVRSVTFSNAADVAAAAATGSTLSTASLFSVNGQAVGVESAGLSTELQQLGFGSQRVGDEAVTTTLEGAKTTGGLLGQALANQMVRRDFFVDTMVDEAVQSTQMKAQVAGSVTSVFVKPYGSYDRTDLGSSDMTGETYGLLVGGNYVRDNVGVTAFAGYEHGDLDTTGDNGYLGMKADSFYVGATAYSTVAQVGGYDVFMKAGAKASFTRHDLSRTLADSASQTKANSVNVGANAQLGIRLDVSKTATFTPTIGLGYQFANVNDFALSFDNTAAGTTKALASDRYDLGTISMPYGEVAMNWQQRWTDTIRTTVGGGVRVLFDKHQTMKATYSESTVNTQYELSNLYEYVTANASWMVNANNEVSVGYTGVMDSNGNSHNMTVKYEYMF